MQIARTKNKRLSAQLPQYTSHFESDFDPSNLTSPTYLNTRRNSNDFSNSVFCTTGFIIPEFKTSIASIQASDSVRRCHEESKKSSLKFQILEQLKQSFISPEFKQSTSTNTGSNSYPEHRLSEDSLVNLQSVDESPIGPNIPIGNSGIITLLLEQSTTLEKTLKKKFIKKLKQTVWTGWFVVAFHSQFEGAALYGKRQEVFVKILGESFFQRKVQKDRILKSFKYDWINRRFRDIENCWESDAIVIFN